MKLEGSYDVKAPRPKVWGAFLDPETLRKAIPGCEKLELIGNDEYKATLKIGVAAVKGTFEGKVRLLDKKQPDSYRLVAGAAAALGHETVRVGLLLVQEPHLALERPLHCRHTDLQRRLVLVVPEGLELFAAGDRLPELLGVEKHVPDLRPGRRDVVGAFELHRLLLCGAPSSSEGATPQARPKGATAPSRNRGKRSREGANPQDRLRRRSRRSKSPSSNARLV